MDTQKFYSDLASFYHLIYQDWDKSIDYQATVLDTLIKENWKNSATILDVSCGIGTQAIGLSKKGYQITASDLSSAEIERAKHEAESRKQSILFSVADMRSAKRHHNKQFDIVISCDNSIPHLLNTDEILESFMQFYQCLHTDGGCIISVRDYEKEDFTKQQIHPYGIRKENETRWLIWQVWDPSPPYYDISMYFVKDNGKSTCKTHVFRSRYFAIGITQLMELMKQAGFQDVQRIDNKFFQPIIVGTKR